MPDEPTPEEQPTTLNWESAPGQFREAHDQLLAERRTLERQLAMHRAGVDAEHPFFPYFDQGYKGALEPDQIKAEWSKLVATQAPPESSTETPPPDPEQAARDQAMRDLAEAQRRLSGEGTAPGQEPTPDPEQDMLATYHQSKAAGMPTVAAQRAGLQKLFDAAVAGDKRVAFDSASEQMAAWRRKHGEE